MLFRSAHNLGRGEIRLRAGVDRNIGRSRPAQEEIAGAGDAGDVDGRLARLYLLGGHGGCAAAGVEGYGVGVGDFGVTAETCCAII